MTPSSWPDALAPAQIAAVFERAREAAAAATLPLFRTALAVDNKHATGFDPVTRADTEAEAAIRAAILEVFPDHAIVGEEWPDQAGTAPFTWIVDPIDGTRAFISGVPVWGTLIGLTHKGRALAGMMAQPFTGECWSAVAGEAVYERGGVRTALATSGVTRLAAAKLTATAPEMFATPAQRAAWTAVSQGALQIRYGLDCYGYCLLVSGHIDLVVEANLKDVDIAPLVPIITGAGGVITTWDGGPAEAGGDCIAAATPELHAQVMDLIAAARA